MAEISSSDHFWEKGLTFRLIRGIINIDRGMIPKFEEADT